MSDCMTFPDTVEEFMEQYKVVDTEGIYMSKGSELVPIFRMKQWFEHKPERKKGKWIEDAETYYKAVNEKGGGVDENTPFFMDDDIACSECLAMFSVIDNCTETFIFCPNCGSDMRGNQDENN